MSKELENIWKGSSLDPTGVPSQQTEKETRGTSVKICGVPAKVRTAYLGNTASPMCVTTSGEIVKNKATVL
jgi:hypothetical protein